VSYVYNIKIKVDKIENMIEQDLIDLGFERIDRTPEDSGAPYKWRYYTFKVSESFNLFSNASDEVTKEGWYVRIIDNFDFQCYDVTQLVNLIIIIKNNLRNDKTIK
jgi:hypothetical protein